MIFTKILS